LDKATLLRELSAKLDEWERSQQWGELFIEVKGGVPTLLKCTTQQELGGVPHHGKPIEHR
jgi:hypothetical protein